MERNFLISFFLLVERKNERDLLMIFSSNDGKKISFALKLRKEKKDGKMGKNSFLWKSLIWKKWSSCRRESEKNGGEREEKFLFIVFMPRESLCGKKKEKREGYGKDQEVISRLRER